MNNCKNPECKNTTESNRVYCSLSCRSTYNNKLRSDDINQKISQSIKEVKKKKKIENLKIYNQNPTTCRNCNTKISYKKRDNKYCSVSCSNQHRTLSTTHKQKTANSIVEYHKKEYLKNPKKCKICDSAMKYTHRNRKTCSDKCFKISCSNSGKIGGKIGGKISAQVQSEERRSKNEKLFAKKCIDHFDIVLTNEAIFNGWDADVIIEDCKIAVLWNGKWHYEKITEAHSVKQVQNRDKIKTKEIREMGYTAYVIKDMGKFSRDKVNSEFDKFISYVNSEF